MNGFRSGVTASGIEQVAWRKSGRSNPSGACVELAALPCAAGVAVRDSKDPDGPALVFSRAAAARLFAAVSGRQE